jgi:hypothetical protein
MTPSACRATVPCPSSWSPQLAEEGMAEGVRQVVPDLRGEGKTLFDGA